MEIFFLNTEIIRLFLLIYVAFSFLTYIIAWMFGGIGSAFKRKLAKPKKDERVLLLTAHPDDECMFFSPFIAQKTAQTAGQTCQFFLLCLTNGNYCGLGKQREKELLDSCRILGIPEKHVSILHHEKLQDGPDEQWDMDVLEEQLRLAVENMKPDVIFTFDDYGISGHTNHRSINTAVSNILGSGVGFKDVKAAYYLDSVSFMRKYLGILDLPLALLFSENIYVSSIFDILRAQKAMVKHRSQLVWFRLLYIVASRYMMFNTFIVQKKTYR